MRYPKEAGITISRGFAKAYQCLGCGAAFAPLGGAGRTRGSPTITPVSGEPRKPVRIVHSSSKLPGGGVMNRVFSQLLFVQASRRHCLPVVADRSRRSARRRGAEGSDKSAGSSAAPARPPFVVFKSNYYHRFPGDTNGGFDPQASLIDVNGRLYGTTTYGGGSTNCRHGCGTVFSIDASGNLNVLHSFTGGSDGAHPAAALLDVRGKLYGTTDPAATTKVERFLASVQAVKSTC